MADADIEASGEGGLAVDVFGTGVDVEVLGDAELCDVAIEGVEGLDEEVCGVRVAEEGAGEGEAGRGEDLAQDPVEP